MAKNGSKTQPARLLVSFSAASKIRKDETENYARRIAAQ